MKYSARCGGSLYRSLNILQSEIPPTKRLREGVSFRQRITISMLRRRKSSFSGDLRACFCHLRQRCLALTPETIYLPHFYCRGFCQRGPKSVPCGTITKHLCIRWECTSVKIRRKMKLGPSAPLVEGRKWEETRGTPSHETFAVQYARFSEFTFTN